MIRITCPWCGEEAYISYEENRVYQLKCYHCKNIMLHEDHSFEAAEKFFERFVRLVQADKCKPLTLEELKKRNGKPVWIVEFPDWGHWELSECGKDYLDDRNPNTYGMLDDNGDLLGWLAYTEPPMEG